jgi:cytochrome c biogenesis protein
MSVAEDTQSNISVKEGAKAGAFERATTSILDLLSSVRFGIVLLILLVIACMIGMLIVQQNLNEFPEYYSKLTPSQKLLYGYLGFFDIYHTWYFNALLLTLSLNIVLASIDRFPKAWTFISRPKTDASATYLRGQKPSTTLSFSNTKRDELIQLIQQACRKLGYKTKVTEKKGQVCVFAERGVWNRLGAYAVHVSLLTVFLGGFLTSQFGISGNMSLTPGMASSEMAMIDFSVDQIKTLSIPLPFTVTCLDIQQKLIKKDGSILTSNTLDWLTKIKIKDEFGEREALVHMNKPYDYRGYRFFQASFDNTGHARQITLQVTPENGGQPQLVTINRNGSATLNDGTKIDFINFLPDLRVGDNGEIFTASADYNNPAAILKVTDTSGKQTQAQAFTIDIPEGAPMVEAAGGYKFKLKDFEKVGAAHVLAVQYDPGSLIFYIGGAMLSLALASVFFFSHQRIWALIEPETDGQHQVVIGGNTNRNQLGFEDRFKRLVNELSPSSQQQQSAG